MQATHAAANDPLTFLATQPAQPRDIRLALAATDAALYRAKHEGRNRVAQAPSA